MNSINLTGRLVKDPEAITTTSGGAKYARFTLAVARIGVKEGQQAADFIPCIAWNKTAEILTTYCKKGQMLGVNGRLSATPYEKDGQKRTAFDVVAVSLEMLERAQEKKTEPAPAPDPDPEPKTKPKTKPENLSFEIPESSDNIDLPFEI